ncbi:nicotinamide riboside transporter PnuC [Riemerella anatipestifer]|uniref:Nicotinamide riboside transporter PnuC n=1 Tax=Riemerella anatipestifer TaxID=34085 RepID=A0AAP6LMJ3_RIEAN|nr:nicotinamide riboside transporter PnuC [Riemerella anatipestifer]MCD5968399.1 nicotinamide riboside transporter PnuC [Riemerella anatipestifer]MCO7355526.1 nicotinamide riboside transporter PnuC [Riemerella anatipestifer]MCU7541148.1 nicotinamide riboside transporter PnuC [Riemerella anatipestifer]MCU7571285.1 nicotinamide riboside transporter PnuC [Riemerella anatipestifer]MCU7597998.1 nicotinamide riboside transporter PnuC [Riemerella anatipestifer]
MNFEELFLKPYETYATYQIILEMVASTFGLLSVYFSMKKNILVYPTGIVSTIIYVYLLFKFGLLGDMMINFYYTVMSIYGWILWSQNSVDNVYIQATKATAKDWLISVGLFVLSVVLVGIVYYFKPYIDQNFSMEGVELGWYHLDWMNYTDIVTTAIFLVGMWLMAKRKVENWLFWILGDLISVPMYLYKGLGITSVQYFIFTILAIIGYIKWKKNISVENA